MSGQTRRDQAGKYGGAQFQICLRSLAIGSLVSRERLDLVLLFGVIAIDPAKVLGVLLRGRKFPSFS
jgi:hypothetical protein